jgi:hypothetical protein
MKESRLKSVLSTIKQNFLVTAGGPDAYRAKAGPDKVMNYYYHDKTLLTWREELSLTSTNICTNGPAVEVVNVGGAVRRYESRLRPPKRSLANEALA